MDEEFRIEHVEIIQRAFPEYQIFVFSGNYDGPALYQGPLKPDVGQHLYLMLAGGHYWHIRSLPKFFGRG